MKRRTRHARTHPRAVARVRADRRPSHPWWLVAAAGLALILILAGPARAQVDYPRVGLSTAPDHYNEEITINEGEPFVVYACVFGPDAETPLDQPLSSVSWVIHQVCCGSTVQVVSVEWNDEFDHVGHPILGVTSTPKQCVDRDRILLATITAVLYDPVPGGGLWAAGPYDASFDCEGQNALFEGMPISINVADLVSSEETTWGGMKALYR